MMSSDSVPLGAPPSWSMTGDAKTDSAKDIRTNEEIMVAGGADAK